MLDALIGELPTYVVTNATITSGDELVDRVTVYEVPPQTPPIPEPSKANGAFEGELVEVLEVVDEDDAEDVADVVADEVVLDVAVVVVCVVPATTASTIMAPKLALFVQPTVADESVEETTSYSAPSTWG
jgi:hypothetical protein